ncbi:MAG: DNA-3-methyladenine glycosylase [Firmicutes bacterium]|nr:DNA-3-methyladenine glycosylase [Bacillota bacterium]
MKSIGSRIKEDFFICDSEILAEKLIGKYLCVHINGKTSKFMISETEAYGINDSACHCYKGRTKRNAPMFCKGGTVYIYLCYGLHEIANIAAGKENEGQGVMIRGLDNTFGPGKITKLAGIDRSFNYEYLPTSLTIWLEENLTKSTCKIEKFKRIGIGYAVQQDQDKLWRFRIKN